MKKRALGCLFSVAAALAFSSAAIAGEEDWLDLREAVAESGGSLAVASTKLYNDGSGESGSADDLFNGIIYAENLGSHAQRVLLLKLSAGKPSVTVQLPDEMTFAPGKRVVLRRVDLFPVTYSGNAKNRMPTDYKVYGISSEDVDTELVHASGLSYPELGSTSAKSNEFYSVDLPSSAGLEGYRKFRLEFLDSPVMASAAVGGIVVSFMEIRLWVELLDDDPVRHELYDARNLATLLKEAGYSSVSYVGQQNQYSTFPFYRLFDGDTFSRTIDSYRALGYIHYANGCYAEIRLPAAYRPDELFYLKNCRLWSLTVSGNERRRAPTAWKIFGTVNSHSNDVWAATDDTGWTELISRTADDWSSVDFTKEGQNTLGVQRADQSREGYRAFRFRPLATQATAENEAGIDFGLNEVELQVVPVNPKGTLRVRASVKGCDFGESQADGALVSGAETVTAPEYVQSGVTGYRVTGYRLETFDYEAGTWTVGESVASRSYAYVPDAAVTARLVWELEPAGYRVIAALADGGNESVTCEPQKVFYQAEESVTITAHPNTDVLENANGATNLFRSAFVRWEGDTNGIADVTSPTITVTADDGRRLTPVFRRDWLVYEYDLANEGGSGTELRMRDGNFEVRLSTMNEFNAGALAHTGSDWLLSGHGSFDLDTKIITPYGEERTIVTFSLPMLGSNAARRSDFTRVVLPHTLVQCIATAFRDQTNLVEAVIDCPDLERLGGNLFTRDISLSRLVFNAPKLGNISSDYVFYNAPLDDTDVSTWHLDSLTNFVNVGNECRFSLREYFQERDGVHGFHGTLTLPRIKRIGSADFAGQQHVTNVVLGCAKGSLEYIGTNAFQKCAALEAVTIGCGTNVEIADQAFNTCTKLKEITFLKEVPPAESIDHILANRTAEDRANIYVSPNRPHRDGFMQAIGGDDPNPPEGAVGVYVTVGGERKAWVFFKESPLDPKGTLFILR